LKKTIFKPFVSLDNGSVSIYLIIILVPIFLFHVILIDFVRVKLSEREAEMAVKTGVRSVLAGFDLDLQPYGLFGLKEEANQAAVLFKNLIEQNITPFSPGVYVHLLDERLNKHESSIKSIYTLANQTVFQQQVLEEMKYSAPIQYTLELVNKFKKPEVTNQLQATEQFSENAEKLEALLEQRNQALDYSWSEVTRFLDLVETMHSHLNDELDKDRDHYKPEFANIENLKLQISTAYSSLMNKFNVIMNHLSDAQEKNTLLDNEKQRLTAAEGNNRTNREIFRAIVIYDVNYFSSYKTGLGKILASFNGLGTQWDLANINSPEFLDSWTMSSLALMMQINSFRQEQGAKESQRQGNHTKSNLKKDQQKSKINQAVLAAKHSNQGCSLLGNDRYSKEYQTLKGSSDNPNNGLYNKYRTYNSNSDEKRLNEQKFDLDSGEQTIKSSILWIKQFTEAAANFRNDLYLDEYALSKFNYRTLNVSSSITNRHLNNQEVEYILYGLGSCSANYSAAYSEMYVMLLVIRTMEALLKPQNDILTVGSPLLVYLAAAAQGAIEAFNDMSKLLKGEAIPILHKTPSLRIDYKDLLRVFLLLHHNEERMISRMQALIELETGADLKKKATYIQGSAVISLRLWFIPKLMKSLNLMGLSTCKLTANRCEFTKIAVMSY
jgi:hypothetical protein